MFACVCAFVSFFFKKTSPQKLLTGLLPNFIIVVLGNRFKIKTDYRFIIGRANQLAIDSTIGFCTVYSTLVLECFFASLYQFG